ncbi:RHS repeat protein [Reichenbachiella carrageenanivorans]|uniref:RHS repeat protein n=1 Tax=Reichenbachiella carrageenanivorans TaxID=2979869 RepID=A0ABY6CZV5_9BACT|nr:RHS repeat domain-containing protein [Reichenbachiella carrageenanivorans]UXX79446.1 RHS repeat protein [Reichenbachiella carrageenanivorans]
MIDNKYIWRIWSLALILTNINVADSQSISTGYNNFLPPSPSASVLGASSGELAHGMTGVSIPLAVFSTNYLSVPLSLYYYSTGTKVDQLASNVGLGWSLQAGGAITRTVRGKRDEIASMAYPSDIDDFSSNSVVDFIAGALDPNQNIDTEPDMFSFNFSGYSGSFVFDSNGEVQVMPYQNLHFETNDSLDYFHITTPDGIKYIFGGLGAIESSKSWNSGDECNASGGYHDFIKTSWYLKKIIPPLGDEVDFEYQSNEFTYVAGKSQTVYDFISTSSSNHNYSGKYYSYSICETNITVKELLLNKISSERYGSITLSGSQRVDVGNIRLDSLIVRNKNNEKQRSISLEYQYSNSDRMFLALLKGCDKNGNQDAVHSFDYYNIHSLPPRLSNAQDHFGYFNGKGSSNGQLLPKYNASIDGVSSDYNGCFDHLGTTREPDGKFAKYGMLKSVVYPRGAITMIEYEPNRLSNNKETGGLRLAKISNIDPISGQKDLTNYHYNKLANLTESSGHQQYQPSFWSYYSKFTNSIKHSTDSCSYIENTYASIQSNSLNTLYNTSGHSITYSNVTVSKGYDFENGATEYEYIVSNDISSAPLFGERINGIPLNNVGWDNGLLKTVEIFKKNGQGSFLSLSKVENVYFPDPLRNAMVPGAVIQRTDEKNNCNPTEQVQCTEENSQQRFMIICRANHVHDLAPTKECTAVGNDNFWKVTYTPPCYGHVGEQIVLPRALDNVDIAEYQNHSFWYYLQSTKSTKYDENGQNPIVVISNFHYDNPEHAQLTSQDNDASVEGIFTTSYKYPQDYDESASAVIEAMMNKNLVGVPIEITNDVNGQIIGANATQYLYDTTLEAIVPNAAYSYENSGSQFSASIDGVNFSSYQKKQEILSRDNYGQVISWRAHDDVVNTIIRGYDQTLVVANITNATVGDVMSILPLLGSDLNAGAGGLSVDQVDALRSELPAAFITSYTYKLGYGVESVTDPNGRVMTYEYDESGRVKYVKDQDGNIRSASLYHNKSQVSNQ